MGALWSLAMAMFFGLSQLASRKGLRGMAVDQGTFVMIVVSTALLVIPFVWVGGPALVVQADPLSLSYFVAAGLLHFVAGFTFMNYAISRIGAARAGSLMSTTPLFATLLAALMLREALGPLLLAGVGLVVLGVLLISLQPNRPGRRIAAGTEASRGGLWLPSASALLAALSWGVSPVLIKAGMQSVPSPVAGVTLATASAGIVYAGLLHARGQLLPLFQPAATRGPLAWQIVSGTLVGLGTLCRWVALSFASAALVTTLSRASLLVTVGLGSKLLGRDLEPVSSRIVWGALLIVLGSVAVVWFEQA